MRLGCGQLPDQIIQQVRISVDDPCFFEIFQGLLLISLMHMINTQVTINIGIIGVERQGFFYVRESFFRKARSYLAPPSVRIGM